MYVYMYIYRIYISIQESEDGNANVCTECGNTGQLICCDGCPNAYHMVLSPKP